MRTVDATEVINREKLSPLQWLVFVLGFLVFFCDVLDTGVIGFVANHQATIGACAQCGFNRDVHRRNFVWAFV